MSAPAPSRSALHLPGVEANPRPGIYQDLIAGARSRDTEYSKIWDLFAFQEQFTIHLASKRRSGSPSTTAGSRRPGVPEMSVESHRQQGSMLAARGYVRD